MAPWNGPNYHCDHTENVLCQDICSRGPHLALPAGDVDHRLEVVIVLIAILACVCCQIFTTMNITKRSGASSASKGC